MKRRITKQELQQACRFCHPPDQDRILFKTQNFYVMLSLGPIVEGHLLIVSNNHIECCAEFQGGGIIEEFDEIAEKVKLILCQQYGNVLLFEHGRSGSSLLPSSPDTHCYHAHLHCIPSSANLAAIVECELSSVSLNSWHNFRNIYQNQPRDYLFIEHDNQKKIFFVNREIRRQYLRYKLATALGVEKLANWLKMPGWRMIWKAKKKLSPYFTDLGVE